MSGLVIISGGSSWVLLIGSGDGLIDNSLRRNLGVISLFLVDQLVVISTGTESASRLMR